MSTEFVNLYIERLLKEIDQLTKSKLLLETQIKMQESVIDQQQLKLNKYQDHVDLDKPTNSTKKKKSSDILQQDTTF